MNDQLNTWVTHLLKHLLLYHHDIQNRPHLIVCLQVWNKFCEQILLSLQYILYFNCPLSTCITQDGKMSLFTCPLFPKVVLELPFSNHSRTGLDSGEFFFFSSQLIFSCGNQLAFAACISVVPSLNSAASLASLEYAIHFSQNNTDKQYKLGT